MLRRPFYAIEDLVKFSYLKNHALANIYLSEAIKMFGVSMVSVFETIYLYIFFQSRGAEFPAAWVFGFFAIFFLAFGLLAPFGAVLSSRLGYGKVALISSPFLFLYFSFLLLLPKYPWLLVPTLLVIIVRAVLFWPGFHLLFATASTNGKRGAALSKLVIATTIVTVIGPSAGGFVISQLGYPVLFMIVLPFIIISSLPLLLVPQSDHKFQHSLGEMLRRVKDFREWRSTLAFAASGAEDEANGKVWPLFLFLLTISFSSLGIIVSLGTALGVLAAWFFGRAADRYGYVRLLHFFSPFLMGAWLIRAGVRTVIPAAFADAVYGIARAGNAVPFLALFYDKAANAQDLYAAIVFREMTLNFGRAVFLGILACVALLTQDFRVLLLVTAILPAFFSLIRYWKP